MTKPEFQLLKCSCVPTVACSFCSSVPSAPSPLACMVAQTSSSTLMMPVGFCKGTKALEPLSSLVGSAVQVVQPQTYHFIFNEITHNLVVEVLNGSPLDALLNILFLKRRAKMNAAFGKKPQPNQQQRDTNVTCSAFRVSSIKICCNFSLTKLIQNCSKPFLCRETR